MKALFLLLLVAPAFPQDDEPVQPVQPIATTSVGMRVRVDELRIRGSQLRAKPVADPVLADVIVPAVSDAPFTVHCANPGSMLGCAEPGRPVRVRDSGDAKRKLRFSLEQVRPGRAWVCVNTNLPNRVVESALHRGAIDALRGYASIRREGFLLEAERRPSRRCGD